MTDLLRSTGGKRWWRQLFAHPAHGTLVGGDPKRRRFDGFLAQLIDLRDHGRCRDPWCDAPIRHHDHIRPARAGGPTSFTNGRGVCARGNYTREMPGWQVDLVLLSVDGDEHLPGPDVQAERCGPGSGCRFTEGEQREHDQPLEEQDPPGVDVAWVRAYGRRRIWRCRAG